MPNNPKRKNDTRNLLESVFDLFSAIPYLKKIMKTMWLFVIVFRILTFSTAVAIGGWSYAIESGTLNQNLSFFLGILTFGYMFRLWDRRDKERSSMKNNQEPLQTGVK